MMFGLRGGLFFCSGAFVKDGWSHRVFLWTSAGQRTGYPAAQALFGQGQVLEQC